MTSMHSTGATAGEQLKQAREAAGLSLADVSARTHMPVRVLQALEDGSDAGPGASVFVRGQLRSYARAIGTSLPDELLPSDPAAEVVAPLVSRVHVPRYRHVAESLGRRAVYVVMTVALVVPVWLATRTHDDGSRSAVAPLDLPAGELSATSPDRTPMVASLAPLTSQAPSSTSSVSIDFTGDSWVQMFGADGSIIEKGLVTAGTHRDVDAGRVSRIVLGNSSAVHLSAPGGPVDLAPFTRANVARFTLSSDGSLAPSAP